MTTSLIIVGYRHPDWARAYVGQLLVHTTDLEIILIDVDPVDRPDLPGVTYVPLPVVSYSRAVNHGLDLCHGDTIIWGNDDLAVRGPFLDQVVAALTGKTLVGLSIAQQYQRDYLEGYFVAMDRRALDDIGYLDERFPGCFEDVDYSWRATRAGYRLVALPLPIRHVDYGRLDHEINVSHRLFREKWNL